MKNVILNPAITNKKHARVTYSDGQVIDTTINGSYKEIREYFAIGKSFNIGSGENDNMQTVAKLEFILPVKYQEVDGNGLVFYKTNNYGTILAMVDGKWHTCTPDWLEPDCPIASDIIVEIEAEVIA